MWRTPTISHDLDLGLVLQKEECGELESGRLHEAMEQSQAAATGASKERILTVELVGDRFAENQR